MKKRTIDIDNVLPSFLLVAACSLFGGCDKINDQHQLGHAGRDGNGEQSVQLCTATGDVLNSLGEKFSNFSTTQHHDNSVGSNLLLDVNLPGDVAIVESCDDHAHVYAHIDNPDTDIETHTEGSTLRITLSDANGDNTPIVTKNQSGGVTVNARGGNVVIINNRVYVDGKIVDPQAPLNLIKTIITVPKGVDLKLSMNGDYSFIGKVYFSNAFVTAVGNSQLDFSANHATIELTGANTAQVSGLSSLNVRITGASNLFANLASSAEVEAKITGSGQITTRGNVRSYEASVIGSGQITHSGSVEKRTTRSLGAGQISFE